MKILKSMYSLSSYVYRSFQNSDTNDNNVAMQISSSEEQVESQHIRECIISLAFSSLKLQTKEESSAAPLECATGVRRS
jgi:hypothetical protein